MKRRSVLAAFGSTLLMLLGVRPRSNGRPTDGVLPRYERSGPLVYIVDATTRGTGKTRLVQATARPPYTMADWADVRPLRGVVVTPSLRPDGTLLRGYDRETGMLYIPDAPKRA